MHAHWCYALLLSFKQNIKLSEANLLKTHCNTLTGKQEPK